MRPGIAQHVHVALGACTHVTLPPCCCQAWCAVCKHYAQGVLLTPDLAGACALLWCTAARAHKNSSSQPPDLLVPVESLDLLSVANACRPAGSPESSASLLSQFATQCQKTHLTSNQELQLSACTWSLQAAQAPKPQCQLLQR